MSATTDYLDRLKSIREKYGCSQPKLQPPTYADSNLDRPTAIDRPYERTAASYYKPDAYTLEKMKILDPHIPTSAATHLANTKNADYALRPQSSMGVGAQQSYQALGEYSRKADR